MNFVSYTIYAQQVFRQKLDFALYSDIHINSEMTRWRKIRLDPEVVDSKFWASESLKYQILEVEEQYYYTLHLNFKSFLLSYLSSFISSFVKRKARKKNFKKDMALRKRRKDSRIGWRKRRDHDLTPSSWFYRVTREVPEWLAKNGRSEVGRLTVWWWQGPNSICRKINGPALVSPVSIVHM